MANARLKMARERTRKRRRSDPDPEAPPLPEVPDVKSSRKSASGVQEELESSAVPDVSSTRDALVARKAVIEERLQALTLGRPLTRLEDRGFDGSGHDRGRGHRDFLLQEMEWMAADFAQERKWRLKSARTLSGSVASYHSKKASLAARREKAELDAQRRVAARIGRDVKKFWTKIDKIISFKVKLQADELRKAAMDRHLHQLVTQTERYAAALALAFHDEHENHEEEQGEGDGEQENDALETVEDRLEQAEPEPSPRSSNGNDVSPRASELQRAARSGSGSDSDSDFEMDAADDEDDDETTIAAEEARGGDASVEEELQALEEESTMSIEALRARYAAAFTDEDAMDEGETEKTDDHLEEKEETPRASSDSDFESAMEESEDDETTIAAAEQSVSASEVDAEVAALREESELSIDELRARYAALAAADDVEESEHEGDVVHEGTRDDDEDDDGVYDPLEDDTDDADDETTIAAAEAEDAVSSSAAEDELALLEEESQLTVDELRARYFGHCVEPEAAISEKVEDVEKTEKDVASQVLLSPTRAGFKRPYLLTSRLSLREYQEAGVNWLVSLCEKRINGILADEMGLGKTIQTISMLAHLACARGVWGPHLIVVPTSCMVNWEMELKRWCPAFKVLTYFGSARRRKALRAGWSRPNAFHVCVTSYQLVVQDAPCFKRKKWFYLILDEAHHIKNWKSLRWQTLLHFNAQRRLLLTGTPLQNNIMELWALMHFLMPHVFASRQEFTYWFNSPLTAMVEGETDVNQRLVAQLHGIIRPFVLRRLKRDVAKQMPRKIEHVLPCRLSKRQRFLYEDFISRSSTRRAMYGTKGAGPNVMSMMNVLMQLRKVCNHPDLFEPRPIASPLDLAPLQLAWPTCASFLVDALHDDATLHLGLYGGRLASFFGSPCTPPLSPDATDALAWWPLQDRLVNQTLRGAERHTAQRRRALLIIDDLALPAPPPLTALDPQATGFADDVRARVQATIARYEAETRRRRCVALTTQRVLAALHTPLYGADLVAQCTLRVLISPAMDVHVQRAAPVGHRHPQFHSAALHDMVRAPEDRIAEMQDVVRAAVCVVPKARARPVALAFDGGSAAATSHPWRWTRRHREMTTLATRMAPIARRVVAPFYESFKRTQLFFPDKRLLQFDCGKLQRLATLLRELKRDGHRCLIFTQMSAMLNILESFLNLHSHTYFRMDGATDVERRQYLMERFNQDDKIFCFILSTRSGGLGVNLVGADVVIFYDSDWNPAMDAQAQDRAHRIGQTRDVHIYRLVSEHTVEENILRKAQQKRHLDALVLRDGQFTTEFFSKASLRELVGELRTEATAAERGEEEEEEEEEDGQEEEGEDSLAAIERAMAELEDEEDVVAMRGAREEELQEAREFDEDAAAEATGGDPNRRPEREEDDDEHEEGDRDDSASETKGGGSTESSRVSTPSNAAVDDRESVNVVDGGALKTQESEPMELDDGGDAEAENAGASDALNDEDEEDDHDLEEEGESEDVDDDDDDDDMDGEESDEEPPRRQRRGVKRGRRDSTSSERGPNNSKKRRKSSGHKTSSSARSSTTSTSALQAPTPQQEQQRLARAAARAKERARDQEEERQLQAWKDSVSSLQHFEDSLNPVDRYALHFREQIDPLFAYVPTAEAVAAAAEPDAAIASTTETIEAIEAQKMMEEAALLADGELHASAEAVELASTATTAFAFDDSTVAEHAALFKRERARVHSERRRRQLTGAAWQVMTCAVTRHPFFYNADTREATWDRPAIWSKNEDDARARRDGYAALPTHVLLAILRCLDAWPDRLCAATVCRAWHSAAQSPSLCRRITASEFVHTHRSSLRALLQDVRRGETLLFGAGVFEISDCVEIATAVRLVATPDARVELAMVTRRAKLRWTARGGVLCGFHVTRRHSASIEATSDTPHWQHLVHVADGGRLRVVYCDLDGNHLGNACVAVSGARESKTQKEVSETEEEARDESAPRPTAPDAATDESEAKSSVVVAAGDSASSTTINSTPLTKTKKTTSMIPSELVLQQSRVLHAGSGSGVLVLSGLAVLQRNTIVGNALAGVTVLGGNAVLRRNRVHGNGRFGVRLLYHANNVIIEENDVGEHPCGALDVENSGRRFVVRWNDMQRDEPTDLPHDHGTWRLVTSRIEERVVEMPPPAEKKPKTKPATGTPRPAIPAAVVSAATAAATTPAVATLGPSVAALLLNVRPSLLTVPMTATTTTARVGPSAVAASSAATSAVAAPTMSSALAAAVSAVKAQVLLQQQQQQQQQQLSGAAQQRPPATASTPSSSSPATSGMPRVAPATAAAAPTGTTTPSAATVAPATAATAAATTMTTPSAATTAATPALKPKIKRKRKPKTEKVLVHGVVLSFRDSCEKRGEKKPKKLRRTSSTSAKTVTSTPTGATSEVLAGTDETTTAVKTEKEEEKKDEETTALHPMETSAAPTTTAVLQVQAPLGATA